MLKKLFILLIFPLFSFSQEEMVFVKNKGQWDNRIVFNQQLADGNLFLEKDGFTYSLVDKSYRNELHQDKKVATPSIIKSHAIQTKFLNSNSSVQITALDSSDFYFNYYLGDDESRWQSTVRSSSKILYNNIYDETDLSIYHQFGATKYDFIVKPNGKPSAIQIQYSGADSLYLKDGNLIIENTISDIKEAKPYSYQLIGGKEIEVPCYYELNGNVLSFKFPSGYDTQYELIIDPVIVFSSLTGSTADNFGFTATYDHNENTYAGGIVYNQGVYPTTLGAFQTTFNTSPWYYVDVSISKFNANGSNLLYSTYLGGSRAEAPHSLSVNNNNELFVMGTTGSTNFPTSAGAYDRVFSGGVDVRPLYTGVYYFNGSDIFVSKFNLNGTALLGSTYVGGTGNDGANTDTLLAYNYGDAFRGEIVIDSNGNAIVASTTNSIDFPTSVGAPQANYGGGFSDGCLFRLNGNLTALTWSSYFGGSESDAAYGVQFDSYGDFYITGGTRSTDLSTTAGVLDDTFNGQEDGFLTRFNFSTNSIVASTYLGTSSYDQSYFVQVDNNDDVYVTGQSLGNYPVSTGVYSRAGSKQFFHKVSRTLDTSFWSTVVGSGRASIDFSPSAFLVNDCGLIYLSGWGGVTNRFYRAAGSSTVGLPLTSDAFQSTTDGSDFYLMVLARDAQSLVYGTYFGGGVSHEHVDGGTSRFDKKGNVYQAVCAGCGGNSDLPTTPGAWSRTNGSTNCNIGVLKMNIAYINSIASSIAPFICLPDSVSFQNRSSGGNTYTWYFGDGDSSSLFEPTHVYADTGRYTVTLIVSDSTGCVPPDTATITIDAFLPKALSIDSVPIICQGDTVQLNARNGQSYLWSPSGTLSNDSISNPLAFPSRTTTYRLISDYYCNSDTLFTTVVVDSVQGAAMADTIICAGSTITLTANGGANYNWYPTAGITNPTLANPQATPSTPTWYFVDITSVYGCTITDSVFVDFHQDSMTISPDTSICAGQSTQISGTGGGSYLWSTGSTSNTLQVAPTVTTWYSLVVTTANGCVLTDSVDVSVFNDSYTVSPDTAVCPTFSALLSATGGRSYLWSTGSTNSVISVSPSSTSWFSVVITTPNGCLIYDTVEVIVHADSTAINPDTTICEASSLILSASGGASYSWYPASGMLNANTANPSVNPISPAFYYVDITTPNGCLITDSTYVDFHQDSMTISPDTSICAGESAQLSGTGGGTYSWNMSRTTSQFVTVTPSVSSSYVLTVISPNGCVLRDSCTVNVLNDSISISPDTTICSGSSLVLNSSGGGSYAWSSTGSIMGVTSSNPTVSPNRLTQYNLSVISPNGCLLKDSVRVSIHNESYGVSSDVSICNGDSTQLSAFGGGSYVWSPSAGLTSSTGNLLSAFPSSSTTYQVTITSPNNCLYQDTVRVMVDTTRLNPTISNDTTICGSSQLTLSASGGKSYSWSPSSLVSSPNSNSTSVSPSNSTWFYVTISNTCNTYSDSVEVQVINPNSIEVTNDTICKGEIATLSAGAASSYSWITHRSIISGQNSNVLSVQPTRSTQYQLAVIDTFGCADTALAFVQLHEQAEIYAGSDVIIPLGSSANLFASGDAGPVSWSNPGSLNCATCRQTQAFPEITTEYIVELIDTNGCSVTDSVLVQIGGVVRVPNTFTPNGDGFNDVFFANGVNITEFTLQIFNRWGQLVFETRDINQGWDGTHLGSSCKVDTYVWKVSYEHLASQREQLVGHVNLVK